MINNNQKIFDVASILFSEWRERLESDKIFKDEKDPEKWVVNEENLEEVMETIQVEAYFEDGDEDEMKALLLKDGRKEANFTDFAKDLRVNLMD